MSIEIDGIAPLIQVFNMPRSLAFYRDILGFEVVSDSGNGDDSSWVWLRLNGCDLMLNDQYEPGHEPPQPPAERVKWHGDTCLYFGCPDPDGAYEYLKSKGVELDPPKVAPYGMKQLYFSDPDNYDLCLQWPAEPENGDG
jgi:catechol 2,3-dioxygenase-like lactoylglutathione lyase family enzyme